MQKYMSIFHHIQDELQKIQPLGMFLVTETGMKAKKYLSMKSNAIEFSPQLIWNFFAEENII